MRKAYIAILGDESKSEYQFLLATLFTHGHQLCDIHHPLENRGKMSHRLEDTMCPWQCA